MVNVDAVFDANSRTRSAGVITRDAGEGCIEANHGFLVHVVDATMAEAYALKTGERS